MTIKAKAIIYAEELEEYGEFQTYFDGVAAELRRLHEVNQELLEAVRGCIADADSYEKRTDKKLVGGWPDQMRAAIAKATGVTKE